MAYFVSDIKCMCKNRTTQITFVILLMIMIFDPISVYIHGVIYTGFFERIGRNAFQYWLLLNSVSWGFSVYHTLFFILPMLITGMVYYQQKNSSMQLLLATRKNAIGFCLSKVMSTFLFCFIVFFLLFSFNLLVTYIVFPGDAPKTDYYKNVTPKLGTFAYAIFQSSPVAMAFLYIFMNSLAIGIFAVFELSIQMIFNFKNQYISLIVPVLVAYFSIYLFDSQTSLISYNLQMILQPLATAGLTILLTWSNVMMTFAMWILIDFILVIIGIVRNSRYQRSGRGNSFLV